MEEPRTEGPPSVSLEGEKMFPTRIPFETAVTSLMKDYGADRGNASIVLNHIRFDRRVPRIEKKDYEDFLQAFSPILHQDDKDDKDGYKIWELAEILSSRWWMGDMSDANFSQLLTNHPNTAYVRRSASTRSAFVIGYSKGDGPKIWKYLQKDHLIITPHKNYSSLDLFYHDWAEMQGVAALRPIHSRKPGVRRSRFNPPGFFARPASGKMEETVGGSMPTNEETPDWSPWLA